MLNLEVNDNKGSQQGKSLIFFTIGQKGWL